MALVEASDARIMIGVGILLLAIIICLAPWFFVGTNGYQVSMFAAGLVEFMLGFGLLFA